jgi:hypothetical protein
MTGPTVWLTDDCCPVCGNLLREHDGPAGQVTQNCTLCGWSTTWDTTPDGGPR